MPHLDWQKSSFSGGAEGNCLFIATTPDGTIRLRESDEPHTVITTAPQGLTALLRHIKSRHIKSSPSS